MYCGGYPAERLLQYADDLWTRAEQSSGGMDRCLLGASGASPLGIARG